ncbi:MAG: sulfite exporter TauE/SafE family protein [Proteobacteria bacterium]|nr:sulfite exporter TauE/SafE family protein [Pseudomonadota bacterium]
MTPFMIAIVMALWLGILTSISPCPLATNIAAVSYIGGQISTKKGVFVAGVLYMFGRMLTYTVLGALLVSSANLVPVVANFLQNYMNIIMGPFLVLTGLLLLNIIKFNISDGAGYIANKLQGKIKRLGVLGAGLLGIVFALSFCPVSAALFFGSLFSVAVKHESSIMLPAIYGIGTALPVLGIAVLMGISTQLVSRAYNKLSVFEIWARKITAVVFILAGIYYCFTYIF